MKLLGLNDNVSVITTHNSKVIKGVLNNIKNVKVDSGPGYITQPTITVGNTDVIISDIVYINKES